MVCGRSSALFEGGRERVDVRGLSSRDAAVSCTEWVSEMKTQIIPLLFRYLSHHTEDATAHARSRPAAQHARDRRAEIDKVRGEIRQ